MADGLPAKLQKASDVRVSELWSSQGYGFRAKLSRYEYGMKVKLNLAILFYQIVTFILVTS